MIPLVFVLFGFASFSGRAMAADPVESSPLTLYGGGSFVVPTGSHGIVRAGDVGLLVVFDEYRSLGFRLSAAVDSVSAPTGPDAEHPWSSLLEFRRQMGIGYRIDPFVVASAGFVVADREGDSVTNLVLPFAHVGLGLRIVLSAPSARIPLFVAPQTGVVPGVIYGNAPFSVVAPVTAVHMGFLIP